MSLSGRNTVSLDTKGRLAIPQRFRQAFPENEQDSIVLTRGFDPCITGYYEASWKEFLDGFYENDLSQEDQDFFEREFIGRLQRSNFDKQGRITLPNQLLKFADLEDASEVLVMGVKNRIEIWNAEVYDEIRAQQESSLLALRGKMRVNRGE